MNSIAKEVAKQNTLVFGLLGVPSALLLVFGLFLVNTNETDPVFMQSIPNMLLGWILLGLGVISLGGFYVRTSQISKWEESQRKTEAN